MKDFLSTKKWFIIGGAGAVAAIAVAIVLIINANKKPDSPVNEMFRTITVHELEGVTVIKSGEETVNAFQGENLKNGDDASVGSDASMTMRMDSDKYVYAESNAHFWIEATGSAGSTKSVINTDKGDTLHHLQNALGSGETYNVSTPASTMAVRGTVFRVYVYVEDGIYYTYLEVYQGSVEVELFTTGHNSVGVTRTFGAGECALMRAGDDFSEFVGINGGEPGEGTPINYYEVPQSVALNLGKIIDSGEELSITKELLFDYVELTSHEFETQIIAEATCTEDGESENVCTICGLSEGTVTIPATGHKVATEITEGDTCTDGVTTRQYCETCNEELGVETVKGDHEYGTWKVTKVANCSENGSEERECKVCGSKQTRTKNATGHTYGDYHVVVNASCTAAGSEQRVCEICGHEDSRAIAATGHTDRIEDSVEASCAEEGFVYKVCTKCGRSVEETIAPKGHTCNEWNLSGDSFSCCPTIYSGVCEICSDEVEKIEPATSGHNYEHIHKQNETDVSWTISRVCDICGETEEGSEETRLAVEGSLVCPVCGME